MLKDDDDYNEIIQRAKPYYRDGEMMKYLGSCGLVRENIKKYKCLIALTALKFYDNDAGC